MATENIKKASWVPNYRSREINGKYLITADHGAWELLGSKEYNSLCSGNLSQRLYKKLEKKGLISTESNALLIDKYYRLWTAPYFTGTTLHIIETTKRCNLQCIYCHISSRTGSNKENDLAPEIAKEIVDFIMQTPAPEITIEFQGGESLLNFDIVKLITEYVEKIAPHKCKTVSFSLVSNFTLLNDDVLDYASKHNISLSTSLDGPKEINDKNRHYPNGDGTFELIESNIKMAQEKGHRSGILTVLTNDTSKRYREIIDYFVKIGVDRICINPVQKLGYARNNWNNVGIGSAERLQVYGDILDYTFDYLDRGVVILDRMFLLALAKLGKNTDVGFMDFRSPCGAVCGQLAYDINGDIYPCDEARSFPEFRLGNVSTHTYEGIIHAKMTSEIIEASLHNQPLCDECAYKPYCGLCPLMCYAESGNLVPKLPDDLRCQFSRFLFDYVFLKIIDDEQAILKILKYLKVRNAYLNSYEKVKASSMRSPHETEKIVL